MQPTSLHANATRYLSGIRFDCYPGQHMWFSDAESVFLRRATDGLSWLLYDAISDKIVARGNRMESAVSNWLDRTRPEAIPTDPTQPLGPLEGE